MHMSDALLSPAVGGAMYAASAAAIGWSIYKMKKEDASASGSITDSFDSGFSAALIQKKDADDLDFSSIFYFNLVSCSLRYLILFFAAPLISAFYRRPEMTAMVRVLGITFLISGVKSVQTAYVSKNMMFKRFFFSTPVFLSDSFPRPFRLLCWYRP